MSTPTIAPSSRADSALVAACFPNAGYTRLWKVVAGLFLITGIFGLIGSAWNISADLHARRTWPSADGEIVSADQRDDSRLFLKGGSISNRTRYWLEYEVGFAVPADQCRTGIFYTGPSETMPCRGIVRTRSTQSTHEVYKWLIHGYHRDEPVKVLHDPNGPEIKIAGEPIWLRFNLDWLTLNVLWVIGFFALYTFAQRRLDYFKSYPEAETLPQQPSSPDKYKLTDLNLP